MDYAGKQVLKTQKKKLKETLYLSDKILDILEETDTVNEEIAQKLKSERTNEEKIDSLLYYLKRRGPDAFHNFVAAIRTDLVYEMLARDLETEYHKIVRDLDGNAPKAEDVSIPAIQRDINSNHIPLVLSPSDSLTSVDSVRKLRVQEHLCTLYTKLKTHMTSANLRELSFASPKPVTFEMVIELQEEYMRSVDMCYKVLGVKDKTKSLHSLIIDLKASEKQLRSEIEEKDKSRNTLSHQYMKLENKNRELKSDYGKLKQQNETLRSKSKELGQKLDQSNVKITELKEKISELSEENKKLRQPNNCEVSTQTEQESVSKYEFCSHPYDPANRRQRNTPGTKMYEKPRPRRQSIQNIETSPRKSKMESTRNMEEELRINPHVKFDRNLNQAKAKSTANGSPLTGLCIGSVRNKDINSDDNPLESMPHTQKRYSPRKERDRK